MPNAAAASPIALPVEKAIRDHYREAVEFGDVGFGSWIRRKEDVRAKVARLIGARADEIAFTPSRDTLWLLGDLVNRGPDSAGVLRRLMGYGAAARCLLGNHDLHLLAIAHGVRPPHRSDTLDGVLHAPDRSPTQAGRL